jgi:hypothetical protein
MLNHDSRDVLYKLCGITEDNELSRHMSRVCQLTAAQYLRRAAFYDDTLYYKTLDKVSFDDLLLSHEFKIEDCFRIAKHLRGMSRFGLTWLKDSVLEAVEIVRRGNVSMTAQMGSKGEVQIIGILLIPG